MSTELTMSEQSIVSTGCEQSRVEMTRESTLSQCKLLHLSGCLLVSFLELEGREGMMICEKYEEKISYSEQNKTEALIHKIK